MTKFLYRVQEGDSVCSLSSKFSIPQIKIISQNNLNREVQAGDMLYLEKLDYPTYKVQLFDTADKIATKFNISKQDLLAINGIEYVFYGLTVLV